MTARPDRRKITEQIEQHLAAAAAAGDSDKVRSLMESLLLWDDFGGSDLLDPVRPSSNTDGSWRSLAPPSVPSDRRHGSQWPVWRTQFELDEYRQEARLRLASNAYAQGLLENLTNNVIGKGLAYQAEPKVKKGQEPTPEQEAAVQQVQAIIDQFLDLNEWHEDADNDSDEAVSAAVEREIYTRVKQDGECFLRLHYQDDGTTLVRFVEPEQVRDGHPGTYQDGWSYGIRHQMTPFEDVKTPLEYAVFWMDPSAPGGSGSPQGTWEFVPSREMVHIKGYKTPATVKRGLSSFLFDTGKALDRAARVQRNTSIGAAIRAATAEFWQHQTATQTQIQSLASGLAGGITTTDPQTGIQTPQERILPGTIRRLPAGQTLIPNPQDWSASYQTAGQGDLRQAAAAHCAPEFWMAETSSGNYSNLESAAAPAVRSGQSEQGYFRRGYRKVLWKAVIWAAECGKCPRNVRQLVSISIEAPAVLHRNELEQAQEDQIGITVGWLDRQTAAERRGLDWQQVSQRNREYQEQNGQQGPQLPMPGEPGAEEQRGGKPPAKPFGEGRVCEGDEKGGQFKKGGGRVTAAAHHERHAADLARALNDTGPGERERKAPYARELHRAKRDHLAKVKASPKEQRPALRAEHRARLRDIRQRYHRAEAAAVKQRQAAVRDAARKFRSRRKETLAAAKQEVLAHIDDATPTLAREIGVSPRELRTALRQMARDDVQHLLVGDYEDVVRNALAAAERGEQVSPSQIAGQLGSGHGKVAEYLAHVAGEVAEDSASDDIFPDESADDSGITAPAVVFKRLQQAFGAPIEHWAPKPGMSGADYEQYVGPLYRQYRDQKAERARAAALRVFGDGERRPAALGEAKDAAGHEHGADGGGV